MLLSYMDLPNKWQQKLDADLEVEYLVPLAAKGVVHKQFFLSSNYPSVDGDGPNLDLGHQTELCALWEVPGVSLIFRNYFIHYALGIMWMRVAIPTSLSPHACAYTHTSLHA